MPKHVARKCQKNVNMCYYCLAESADGGCSDAHLSEVRPPCDYHCCIPRPLRGDFRTPVIPCPSPIILSLQSSCLSNILSLQLSCLSNYPVPPNLSLPPSPPLQLHAQPSAYQCRTRCPAPRSTAAGFTAATNNHHIAGVAI